MKVHDTIPEIGTVIEWDIEEIFTRHSGDTRWYQEEGWDDGTGDETFWIDPEEREEMPLDDVWLTTLELKTRDEHYPDVVESIKTHGFLRPCTAKMDDTTKLLKFIDGHHRLAAAIELGMTAIPVVVVSSRGVSDDSGNWSLGDPIPSLEESGIRI